MDKNKEPNIQELRNIVKNGGPGSKEAAGRELLKKGGYDDIVFVNLHVKALQFIRWIKEAKKTKEDFQF